MIHRLCFAIVTVGINTIFGQDQIVEASKSQILQSAQKFEGFFDFYYVKSKDAIYLEVDKLNQEFLYVSSLSQGVGSNDIGLDRGQLGDEKVVYFKEAGDKLLLVEPNLKFRAITTNELERKSVREAFASSVLYGFPIVETYKSSILIDITPFLMQDTHGVSERLRNLNQGSYNLDKNRSAIELSRTKAFEKNVEFDVLQTFKCKADGAWIQSVSPESSAVTVHQHYSFVKLPDLNYKPRKFDPRAGAIPFTYYDYATDVHQPTLQRYIIRHRLEKVHPENEISRAVEPIVYYLDNGVPEPVRSALLDGAKWWNEAFEEIGFKDAFQVKVLPDDVDPLDVRYNVIQWVHRSTRGWSYGSSVVDPRTGEIIKGHVSLGSLRIRQDYMIALGLTEKPFQENGEYNQKALDMALARIRQLSAHEIGHTLGFAHNFASSSKNRSSVMDYPHPLIRLENDEIILDDAYDVGIGNWDKIIVAYAYSDFPDGVNEDHALKKILENAVLKNNPFITDSDARPIGGAHPKAHLWDNGENAVSELNRIIKIRRHALNHFSLDHLREGESYALLSDRLVPIYLLHRYQAEAVVKLIGGVNYDYGVKGTINSKLSYVPGQMQREALQSYLDLLAPAELEIPDHLKDLLLPRPYGYPNTRENLQSQTGVVFDLLGTANVLSDRLLGMLLHPERASRLIAQVGRDDKQLGLKEVLSKIIEQVFNNSQKNNHAKQIQEIVQQNFLKHLMVLGRTPSTYGHVRSIVFDTLNALKDRLIMSSELDHASYYIHLIERYLEDSELTIPFDSLRIPDGSPIGTIFCDFMSY